MALYIEVILVYSIVLIYHIDFCKSEEYEHETFSERLQLDQEIRDFINEDFKTENIRNLLREITSSPHLAGTKEEKKLAEYISSKWINFGFDEVKVIPFDAAISNNDPEHPSTIKLRNKRTGHVEFQVQRTEKDLDGHGQKVVPPFIAFSATGNTVGDLVYVNYARDEDFLYLESRNVTLHGKICIARYGKIFRGDKVKFATLHGASGVILYSDPQQVHKNLNEPAYPHSIWLPGSGVQRGTIVIGVDPLTPGYPGIEGAYHEKNNKGDEIDNDVLPSLPVHPIGYDDAKVLLSSLKGETVPKEWAGSLPIKYKFGGEFIDNEIELEMDIFTKTSVTQSQNIVAVIKGSVEPDRYIMIGSHYDAWSYGAVDPGMATLMESSRVFAELLKTGWRPRRTLMFCAWGSEEMGTIGSREFVEKFSNLLAARVVSYINCDGIMEGSYSIVGGAMPLLYDVVKDSARRVPNPNQTEIDLGRATVYDTWNHVNKGNIRFDALGSGSDYADLIGQLGITCATVTYLPDPNGISYGCPLYHTGYDTFYLVNTLMDPTMKYHRATGQVFSQLTYSLLDSPLLPMNVISYSERLRGYNDEFRKSYGNLLESRGMLQGLDFLERSIRRFENSCKSFDRKINCLDYDEDDFKLRMYNDAMMQLERNFIDPLGLPGRKYSRNVLHSPTQHDAYSASTFPGLTDSLYRIEQTSSKDQQKRWNIVAKQLAIVMTFIEAACDLLDSVGGF